MGWLILSLVIAMVCIVINLTCDSDEHEGIWLIAGVVGTVGIIVFFVLGIYIIDAQSKAKATIAKYENLKTISTELNIPSETIIEEIIDTNKKICNHKVHANNFMTTGLYSKKVGELPLLEIPEVMKVGPIDYE